MYGGGIENYGGLALTNSTLSGNSAFTLTRMPQPLSDAIDKIPMGTNGYGTSLTEDQRADPRPVAGGSGHTYCDVGAVEYAPAATPTLSPTPSPTPAPTSTFVGTPTPTPTATSTATETVTPPASATPSSTLPPGQFLWGDVLCIGGVVARDALDELLYAGDLDPLAHSVTCPAIGTTVHVAGFSPHKWGDLNCDGQITSSDGLDALTQPAGLPQLPKTGTCPDIGSIVTLES